MADGQSLVLKKLQSEVSCPLCLDIFKEPKRLPCEHVYCKGCLHGLVLRSANGNISCPECRKVTPVTNRDVSILPTAFQINRLVEMYRDNQKSHEDDAESPVAQLSSCKLHKSQPLTMYCETCEKLVCQVCVLQSCATKGHRCGSIDEMVKKSQTALEGKLEPFQAVHKQISSILSSMQSAERQNHSTREEKLHQVMSTFHTLSEVLEQEKEYCMEAIEEFYDEQGATISAGKEEVMESLAKLEPIVQPLIVKTSSRKAKQDYLMSVANKKQIFKNAKETARITSSCPAKLPELVVQLLDPSELEAICKTENLLHKTYIEKLPDTLTLNKKSEASVHFSLYRGRSGVVSKGEHIVVQVKCHDDTLHTFKVAKTATNEYSFTFVPQERGKHDVSILYNDKLVCGSPLPIYVITEPEKLKSKKPSYIKVKNITTVMCHKKKVYLSGPESNVLTVDSSTKFIQEVFDYPGVGKFVAQGNFFYVTDTIKHRVVKLDQNGSILKSIGTRGESAGEFRNPNGIGLGKSEEIFVCDAGNHRIQVLSQNLEFVRGIGSHGNANGCFEFPVDLDFDDTGNLFVADQNNHRIQVLTPQGQHIRNIGKPGKRSGSGDLHLPLSIAIHRDMLYVADRNLKGTVSVFKTTGEFVVTFGVKGILSQPLDIAIDDNGFIHIIDSGSKLVSF